ncbi:MAG: preprotein translocase subunit SecA [Acidobacteriota bacterium]|nr:preprotein translocase subunit SecA [Acidobacteriota bacterium]
MLGTIVKKVFGTQNERELKRMLPAVKQVGEWEPEMQKLSDDQLRAKTDEYKQRLADGETVDDLLPEAFATAREAAVRTLGMRPYDVQVLGGMVLHKGAIAEMKTGEGKTLTATMPLYLNALEGKGAILVTVNDYLAKRDAEWMGQVYRFLGLSVGCILHDMNDTERRDAYACDITYGTNNEIGFDYLRDNMKHRVDQLVQRGYHYAIVDEVDSVLIDEARTPLIISGPAEGGTSKYYDANKIVLQLNRDTHYTVDEKDNHALFTEAGIQEAERLLGLTNLYDPANIEILHCLEQALKAHFLFTNDVDYLVRDGQVIIVDQHTGRPMPGRRYSDGLHQALEAKEEVTIEKQNQTMASVTFQNFFRMFSKLSGMTGTAETEAPEFLKIYDLGVFVIPTNKPITREDANDFIYGTRDWKFNAICDEIIEQNQKGRPVLVGTIAIETSEMLSAVLRRRNIKHVVLNAKYHEQEADIVAQAGRLSAVTIATNMAGRGTDIILGGNAEALAKYDLARDPEADYDALFEKYTAVCKEEKKKVLDLGGLCIIGTERHESRRIDNQLRGRSGRQGDPGMTRFYLSMEDKLMRLFGNERMKTILANNMEEGVPIEHKMVNRAVEKAQKAVEARNFDMRKNLLDYDDVMNKQRTTFYKLRYELMTGDPREFMNSKIEAISRYFVESNTEERVDDESKAKMFDSLKNILRYQPDPELAESNPLNPDAVVEDVCLKVREAYEAKWDELGVEPETVKEHERFIILYMVDQQWKDHMRNMDHLKQGISLMGYAQKDPLIEYKKASFEMFNDLMDRMDEEVVKTLVFLKPQLSGESMDRMREQRRREANAMRRASQGDETDRPKTYRRDKPKQGRNEPCYCGSGKKFKHCHGRR